MMYDVCDIIVSNQCRNGSFCIAIAFVLSTPLNSDNAELVQFPFIDCIVRDGNFYHSLMAKY